LEAKLLVEKYIWAKRFKHIQNDVIAFTSWSIKHESTLIKV